MKKHFMKHFYKLILNKVFKIFTDINIKPLPIEIKATEDCLVIAPHPDDESIGCGGILNTFPKNFEVICVTHKNTEIRKNEFDSAMNLAGVKHSMLDLEDKNVKNGYEKFKNIDIKTRDYIFIPYIFDQHRDHKAISTLLKKLLSEKKHKKSLKIVFYEVWSAINMPTHYLNISNVWENKAKCIEFYSSQGGKEYVEKIGGLNNYRGLLKRIPYAEAFLMLDVNDFVNIVKDLTI